MIFARIAATIFAFCSITIGTAFAMEPAQCRKITFADTGWTDVTATTALATVILQGLDYETEIKPLTLPATYTALATDDVDIFLGNWMPVMQVHFAPYRDKASIDIIRANLTGAKFALATNKAGLARGIRDLTDIAGHRSALKNEIYGVKPDNGGNYVLLDMIAENKLGLGALKVVEFSEQGLFAQVERKNKAGEAAVFLAWEPHPMNSRIEPIFLTGSDDIFGSDQPTAEVQTLTRTGFADECQNVGSFLENLEFTLDIERNLMQEILTKNKAPKAAAKTWIKDNPEILATWLDGLTTINGNDPHSALTAFLDE